MLEIYWRQCDKMDASVFSGELVSSHEDRADFKEFLQRWLREVERYERDESQPDTEAATTANAFRNKDTHEIRYVLSNEHNEAEWEDVVITPASMSAAGQEGGE